MRSLYVKYLFCALFILCGQFSFMHHAVAQDQKTIDDQLLQAYFAKNHITPTKGPSGIYYTISKEGVGQNILPGANVTIDYTGHLLDGTVFDSNVDPKFQHPEPFTTVIGVGRVIAGWDKGITLLKKGSKATLYIPSGMGYGPRGNGRIPANSVLVFDVEVVEVTK